MANSTFCGGGHKFFSNRAKFTIDVFGVSLAIVYYVTTDAVLAFGGCTELNKGLVFATGTDGTIEGCFRSFIFEITTAWTIVALGR